MRFKVVLQRNYGGWWDTDYWLEINLPGTEKRGDLSGLMLSGNPLDMLLIAAIGDESLLPNNGFRLFWKSVDEEIGAVVAREVALEGR